MPFLWYCCVHYSRFPFVWKELLQKFLSLILSFAGFWMRYSIPLKENTEISKKLLTNPSVFAIIYVLWNNGVWLSLVERLVRDQEAGSSNLLTPTKTKWRPSMTVFLFLVGVWGLSYFCRKNCRKQIRESNEDMYYVRNIPAILLNFRNCGSS